MNRDPGQATLEAELPALLVATQRKAGLGRPCKVLHRETCTRPWTQPFGFPGISGKGRNPIAIQTYTQMSLKALQISHQNWKQLRYPRIHSLRHSHRMDCHLLRRRNEPRALPQRGTPGIPCREEVAGREDQGPVTPFAGSARPGGVVGGVERRQRPITVKGSRTGLSVTWGRDR